MELIRSNHLNARVFQAAGLASPHCRNDGGWLISDEQAKEKTNKFLQVK